jgi:hypothetical protein
MNPRFNFAPVSGAQSSWLRIASGWFLFNGIVNAFIIAVVIVGFLLGKEVFGPPILGVLAVLIALTAAVGLVWTGSLLGRGSRLGGILALGFVLLPAAFAAIARQPMRVTDIAFGVIGVIVLSLIWRELR